MRKPVILALSLFLVLVTLYVLYKTRDKSLPQNQYDVAILEQTLVLLENPDNWSKNDDRKCLPEKVKLSLYCALKQASIEVNGKFNHRAAALQQIRYTIDEVKPNNSYRHRLRDYNNDPSVTLEEVHFLLQKSIKVLQKKWKERES